MLSQKLQDDLMAAYQKVYEEKRGHAAGASDTEKQASQLASDVRYKAKGKVPEGASKEEKRKIFLQILNASPASGVVKAMAKEKLLGEEVVHEKYGLQQIGKLGQQAKKLDRKLGTKKFAKDVAKKKEDIKSKLYGTTRAGKATRIAGLVGGSMVAGAVLDAAASKRGEKRFDRLTNPNYPNPFKVVQKDSSGKRLTPKPLTSAAVKYEEVVHEMRFDDGKEGTEKRKESLRKKRGLTKAQMDKHPQFKTEEKESTKDKLISMAKKKKEKYDKQPQAYKNNPAFGDESHFKTVGEGLSDSIKEVSKTVKGSTKKIERQTKRMDTGGDGTAYRGESVKPVGNIFNEKKMDPVGQEDGDINNDGKKDGTDKYLANRRKAIGKAIAKKRGRVKEGFSAWRIDLDFNEQVKK